MKFFRKSDPDRDAKDWAMLFVEYSEAWPKWDDSYDHWMPVSLLPSSKQDLKEAVKTAYFYWDEPLTFTVYAAFVRMFVSLGYFIEDEDHLFLEIFRKGRTSAMQQGTIERDPLSMCKRAPIAMIFEQPSEEEAVIEDIRDREFERNFLHDLPDASEAELNRARKIVLMSQVEASSLAFEWSLYTKAIGRDQFLRDEKAAD